MCYQVPVVLLIARSPPRCPSHDFALTEKRARCGGGENGCATVAASGTGEDLTEKRDILHDFGCFWCVFKAMNTFHVSNCPVCRNPYYHFPRICELFHFLLLKLYPMAYKRRERQVAEEEKKIGNKSPQFDSQLSKVTDDQNISCPVFGEVSVGSNATTCGGDHSLIQDSPQSIASVDLDMKLYTFDTGSRKPSSCISYEALFSSLAFADNRLTLAAGTTTGQAVKNLCWQSSKLVTFDENKYTDAMVLLAGDIGDSILMPDPLPSKSSSGSSGSTSRAISLSSSEKSPINNLLKGLTLAKLHAPNVKDDMDVFSPLVEVQPLTPSTLDKLWDDHDGSKKVQDRSPSFGFPSQKYGLPNEGVSNNHPILDWKSNSASK
ncbi:hypothetical protein ACS0TY_006733 [Phlomoides rotata]